MRYNCPKCGRSFTVRPAEGTCPQCETTLVQESESHEAEPVDDEATPKHKL